MPRQATINRARAERAARALKAQRYWDCGESYAVADLLCDLQHLCDRERWDFAELLDSGSNHYANERTPDDIEESARAMHRRGDYPIIAEENLDSLRLQAVRAILRNDSGGFDCLGDQIDAALSAIDDADESGLRAIIAAADAAPKGN